MVTKLAQLVLSFAITAGYANVANTETKQQPPQVAVLNPFSLPEPGFQAFMNSLRKLGFIEGKDFILQIRWADGRLERLPQLAAELVTYGPDVIFAPSIQGVMAAKQATTETNTPIVAVACDPLDKLVQSLARPGGNTTGFSCIHSELAGKRVEMLKELLPDLKQVAVLYNPTDPNKRLEFEQVRDVAKRMQASAHAFEVTKAEQIESAFDAMTAQRAEAVIVLVDPLMIFHRKRLAELALARRLALVSGFKEFVEAGGVISYGADRSWVFQAAAGYVAKILRGEKASELPVQEPSTFELYINGRVADELGIKIPASMYVRADKILD
jgi:putative tryptophan/tyrosine transport system substrate-binding protein